MFVDRVGESVGRRVPHVAESHLAGPPVEAAFRRDPREEGGAEAVRLEGAVPRRSGDNAGAASLVSGPGVEERISGVPADATVVDLVPLDPRVAERGGRSFGAGEDLFCLEVRLDGKQAQAVDLAGAALHRIDDPRPEHLIAAAHAEDRCSAASAFDQRRVESVRAQRGEVVHRRLRPRQDDEVGAHDVPERSREANAHTRLARDRVGVGEVAHPSQRDHRHVQRVATERGPRGAGDRSRRDGVFSVGPQALDPRQHAENREAGERFDHRQARLEDRESAPEPVDDEPGDQRAILVFQQLDRSVQAREDAAAVDVPDDDDGQPGGRREPHVREVAFAQVDLREAAGAFAEDHVEARAQILEGFAHDAGEARPEVHVLLGLGVTHRFPHHDHLRAAIVDGLQKDRIHRRLGLDAGGERLRGLRARDLRAVAGDVRVE